MDHFVPPGRFAEAVAGLAAAGSNSDALRTAIAQNAAACFGLTAATVVPADSATPPLLPLTPTWVLTVEPAELYSAPDLTAYAAVAGALLTHALRAEVAARDQATVLSRLDQLNRDLNNTARSEWVAQERLRIGQDLHDRVAQTLFGLGLTADWILTHVDKDEQLRPDLQRLKQMAATGLRQVRESIFALSSGPVEAQQLTSAVQGLLSDLEGAGIAGSLRTQGDLALLTPDVTDALYQIVREALVNVRRHADASSVLVAIRVQTDRVTTVVQDDGRGLPPIVAETYQKSGAHLGLLGMESRAQRLGGTITLTPGDECGLIVTATIPLTPFDPIERSNP